MNTPIHARTARETIVNPSGLLQLSFLRMSTEMLQEELSGDESDIAAMKQELSLLTEGRLYIRERKGRCYFSMKSDRTRREVGISSDTIKISELARRAYLKQRIAITEQHVRRLRKAHSYFKDAYYEHTTRTMLTRYASSGVDLSRVLFTKEQNKWLDEPYSPNPFYKDKIQYQTNHGIPVRSKSESIIGSYFELIGLPFRTDDLVTIRTEYGDAPFRDNYFADFKVPNLSGGITIHEHLGALHLADYPDNSLKRLNDYHNFTIYELPDRPVHQSELTFSFEADISSHKKLHRMVRRILLPNL